MYESKYIKYKQKYQGLQQEMFFNKMITTSKMSGGYAPSLDLSNFSQNHQNFVNNWQHIKQFITEFDYDGFLGTSHINSNLETISQQLDKFDPRMITREHVQQYYDNLPKHNNTTNIDTSVLNNIKLSGGGRKSPSTNSKSSIYQFFHGVPGTKMDTFSGLMGAWDIYSLLVNISVTVGFTAMNPTKQEYVDKASDKALGWFRLAGFIGRYSNISMIKNAIFLYMFYHYYKNDAANYGTNTILLGIVLNMISVSLGIYKASNINQRNQP
uniref:Uncharacterized protein n=1 Tax=Megaviridae environmental sample TaxID=1737588 RepID=A0A5J6VL08_9VIRU|nr:MAG: hypothetical protein [Megaviridae environmental sample]